MRLNMLERIKAGEAKGADAHVIACFDDSGLDAARALANAPVVGIGEVGFLRRLSLVRRARGRRLDRYERPGHARALPC